MDSKVTTQPDEETISTRDVQTTMKRSSVFTSYVGRMQAAPHQQLQMSLGVFDANRPEKGFSIELDPDPNPAKSVVAQILTVGSGRRYELILNLANNGDYAVTADVWQM